MKILIISNPNPVDDETGLVNRMFEAGLEIFHLRKPEYSKLRLKEFIGAIEPKYRNRIVLHSYYRLIGDFTLRGVHLTEKRKKRKVATRISLGYLKIIRPDMKTSISFHDLKELQSGPPGMSYAFLSPVFDSISKSGYKAAFETSELEKSLSNTDTNIVALGGCQAGNIKHLKKLGFYGAAFLGAVWNSRNPVQRFLEIKDIAWELQPNS
ncbi:MAG: thiamine phosphate synthase [Proteobacteria bacterium]|nr:thiamine phosphate synthase [Pseudomonadota bacterium]